MLGSRVYGTEALNVRTYSLYIYKWFGVIISKDTFNRVDKLILEESLGVVPAWMFHDDSMTARQ